MELAAAAASVTGRHSQTELLAAAAAALEWPPLQALRRLLPECLSVCLTLCRPVALTLLLMIREVVAEVCDSSHQNTDDCRLRLTAFEVIRRCSRKEEEAEEGKEGVRSREGGSSIRDQFVNEMLLLLLLKLTKMCFSPLFGVLT